MIPKREEMMNVLLSFRKEIESWKVGVIVVFEKLCSIYFQKSFSLSKYVQPLITCTEIMKAIT